MQNPKFCKGTTVRIHLTREACCSQDDQLGPLEAVQDLQPDATLQELSEVIASSGFLQFSSTHAVMVGQAGNEDVVRVSALNPGQPPALEYLKPPHTAVRSLAGSDRFRFRFVFDIN